IGCNDLGFHYCARLEEILDSFPEEERAHSLLRIGQGLHIGRAYSDSIEVLSKALKLAQNSQMDELQVDILLFLSKSNSLLQNDKNAWSYCTEALRIARQQKNESALAQIYADMFGILKAIDSGNSHIPILRKALRFAKERPLLEVQITDLLGDEYSSINLSLAEDFYRKSIELSELVRGQLRGADPANLGFLNRFAHTYSSLEKVLVKQKRVDEALVIAEKRRGLALKDAFYKDSSNGNSRPVETVTDLLDIVENCKDAAFLLYSNHGDELFSWLIKSDRSIVFSTVDLTNHGTPYTPPLLDLADLAYQYLTEFACELPVCPVRSQTSPTVPCTMNYLHELYEYIVKPFEPHLAKVAWLVIVPDTNLPAIPYGLLVSKEHEFLIDRLAISTAPSILFFQMMTERHVESASENNQAPALIIGNPTMPKAWDDESQDWFRLESLDYSEKEARNIAQLLEVAPIIGPQATKECFLAASASAPIIHLATHSIWFDPNHPFSKGNIALAPTDLDDGILCTSDIGRQKMRARLVVLNLCRSADGHASADGVNGIARAFLASGACSVLSTIPDLDDDFSEDMIFMFYSYWLFQDKKLPEALREVMIEGRNKDSDPRKWGGYLLTCGNF
ncbi:MAG: CHAT domain-containing protein, partial [Cyanobacteria bacterium HKST-UBA02]|nr:CHAT domain-containing protein [Cyanobacteria bacterium HKST-UBA02]